MATKKFDYKKHLEIANAELLPLGAKIELTEKEGDFCMVIRYGKNLNRSQVFASNYYESELEVLITEALEYAKKKILNLTPVWVVTHVTLSSNESKVNGVTKSKIFSDYDEAKDMLKKWAEEEKQLCEEENRDFFVMNNEPALFRMAWSGFSEQVRININLAYYENKEQ